MSLTTADRHKMRAESAMAWSRGFRVSRSGRWARRSRRKIYSAVGAALTQADRCRLGDGRAAQRGSGLQPDRRDRRAMPRPRDPFHTGRSPGASARSPSDVRLPCTRSAVDLPAIMIYGPKAIGARFHVRGGGGHAPAAILDGPAGRERGLRSAPCRQPLFVFCVVGIGAAAALSRPREMGGREGHRARTAFARFVLPPGLRAEACSDLHLNPPGGRIPCRRSARPNLPPKKHGPFPGAGAPWS